MKNIISEIKWKLLYVIKFVFISVGRTWNDFYGWMLDYQDRKLTLDDILSKKNPSDRYKGLWHWEKGEDYLKYLIKHGMKPNHKLFDLGCGYGRCTIPILKFQTREGNYIGSEISKRRLALAEEWVEREKLTNKNYSLIYSKDLNLNFINDNTLDLTWVLSVFNHMPDNIIYKSFYSLSLKTKKGGKIFAFYTNPSANMQKSVKFFPRTDKQMSQIVEDNGFSSRVMKDWDDVYSFNNRDLSSKMMICTKL